MRSLRTYFILQQDAFVTAVHELKKSRLTTVITTIVIALTLALPALLGILIGNFESLFVDYEQSSQIVLYLKSASPAEELALLEKIRSMPMVAHAKLVTPADGLKELQEQQPGMEDILSLLPENPLPTVIEVSPSKQQNTRFVNELYESLKKLSQVEQAKFDSLWLERLYAIYSFIRNFTQGLILLLGFAVTVIIANTLKLVIHSHQQEIQVLKLIGASNQYIIRPFLYMGIFYGVFGAVIAVFFVSFFMVNLEKSVDNLAQLYQVHYSLQGFSMIQMILFITSSGLLGGLGASLSIKRQLASIDA
ncbi:MAG: permease-like cell division protein FtsX [Legionella sp.]